TPFLLPEGSNCSNHFAGIDHRPHLAPFHGRNMRACDFDEFLTFLQHAVIKRPDLRRFGLAIGWPDAKRRVDHVADTRALFDPSTNCGPDTKQFKRCRRSAPMNLGPTNDLELILNISRPRVDAIQKRREHLPAILEIPTKMVFGCPHEALKS